MRNWIATHYPHYPADEAEWFIYVPPKFEARASLFGKSDRVAFYEVGMGPDQKGKGKRPAGRKAIICLATGAGIARATTLVERYEDGGASSFTRECPCESHDFTHCLPLKELCTALGWNFNPRGWGGGAGFDEISEEDFKKIESGFLASPRD